MWPFKKKSGWRPVEDKLVDGWNREGEIIPPTAISTESTHRTSSVKETSYEGEGGEQVDLFKRSRGGRVSTKDFTLEELTPEMDKVATGEDQYKSDMSTVSSRTWDTLDKDHKFDVLSRLFDKRKKEIDSGSITIVTYDGEGMPRRISLGHKPEGSGSDLPEYYIATEDGGIKATNSQAWESAVNSHKKRYDQLKNLSDDDIKNPDKIRDIWFPKESIEAEEGTLEEWGGADVGNFYEAS